MKRLPILGLALVGLLLAGTAHTSSVFTSLVTFGHEVRQMTSVSSTSLLPDSTLIDITNTALVWTSIDVGGVELQHTITTVDGTRFYAIPDTVTEVLFASVLAGDGSTRSIRAWYPQFFDALELPSLNAGEDQAPSAYNYWADTIQLMPTPVQIDEIVLKCYVEHPELDSSGTISFGPGYTEAALFYASYRVSFGLERYDAAAFFLNGYTERKTALKEKQKRKFEAISQ